MFRQRTLQNDTQTMLFHPTGLCVSSFLWIKASNTLGSCSLVTMATDKSKISKIPSTETTQASLTPCPVLKICLLCVQMLLWKRWTLTLFSLCVLLLSQRRMALWIFHSQRNPSKWDYSPTAPLPLPLPLRPRSAPLPAIPDLPPSKPFS